MGLDKSMPQKEPLILSELNRLDSAVSRLTDLQASLRKRLEIVSSITQGVATSEKRQSYNVPIAEQISIQIDRLQSLCLLTEETIQNLEI